MKDVNLDVATKESIKAQKQTIINLLKENGEIGVTTKSFKARNIHHTDRISKLRKDGYVIDCTKIDSGNYKYTLVSEPTGEQTHETSLDKFIKSWNSLHTNLQLKKDDVESMLKSNQLNIVTKKGGFKTA